MSRRTIFSLLAAAATLAPAGLAAQPANDTEQASIRVSFADLNLGSPAGRASFDRRIEHAIDLLCGRPEGNLDMTTQVWKCRQGGGAGGPPPPPAPGAAGGR